MVRFGSISSSFGLTMGILARLRVAKIRTMARPNSPDMPPKRAKKVRLGISIVLFVLYCMCVFINGWMDGWMDGWMEGGREGGREGGMDGWMDGWMDG